MCVGVFVVLITQDASTSFSKKLFLFEQTFGTQDPKMLYRRIRSRFCLSALDGGERAVETRMMNDFWEIKQ